MSASSVAYSQDTEKQLQQLKEQLEMTTKEMEGRISALEQQLEKEKETREQKVVSGGQVAVGKQLSEGVVAQILEQSPKSLFGESNNVGAKFQGQLPSEPTYDLLREADEKIERLQERESSFEFHGYFRSGFGLNGHRHCAHLSHTPIGQETSEDSSAEYHSKTRRRVLPTVPKSNIGGEE